MSEFDAKSYRDNVLKPHARGEGYEQLREVLAELQRDPDGSAYARLNLPALYDIPEPVSADALRSWYGKIFPALNKAAQLPSAKLLKQLLQVLEKQGHDLHNPAFWGGLRARQQEQAIASLETGMQQLRTEYPLGVVTIEELTERLQAIGVSGVTEGSIRSVAERQGLGIHASFDPPTDGMPAALRPIWQQVSRHTDFQSIIDILLLHRTQVVQSVTFIDGLADASGPVRVTEIEQARLKSEQSRDSDALQDAQKFLVALQSNCTSDESLHGVVLAALVDLVAKQLGRGKPKLAVRDHLVGIGYDPTDASRLVSALSGKSSGGGPRIDLAQVREQLSRGALDEAERTLGALSVDEQEAQEYAELTKQIAQLRSRKAQALDEYRSALQSRDFERAARSIREAISIDPADESLAALHDALPPVAPEPLRIRLVGTRVSASWAQDRDSSVVYSLVRAEGRPPTAPGDGVVLASGVSTATADDEHPAVGTHVWYAVFATRDGRTFSDPATADTTLLPRPEELTATSAPRNAQLSWRNPTGSAGALVTRVNPDGSSQDIEVPRGSTLGVAQLSTGNSYRFSVR